MRKGIRALLLPLFLWACLAAWALGAPAGPGARAAEQGGAQGALKSVAAADYGPLSPWQSVPRHEALGLEVERQTRTLTQNHFSWRYTRYVYYNTQAQGWYAAAQEQSGPHCQEGSGRWEETTQDQPLEQTGLDGEDPVYQGGWFNQEVRNQPTSSQQEMYRSRQVRKVSCEVSSTQILLFPGDSRQLTVNFFDGGAMTYLSSDNAVATVDQTGLVSAQAVGAAQLTVTSSAGRQVVVEVLVCQQKAHIPDGVYTLRLLGSTKALSQGSRITSQSDNLVVKDYTGERTQRFVVTGASQATFTLHPLNHRKWYVDMARIDGKVALGSNVQTHKVRDRGAQYWRAVYVPDGSYILYSRTEPKLVMGAESQGAGNNVRLEAMELMDEADRWLLVKADTAVDPVDAFARPLARDGASYVQTEYGPDHQGVTFAANGRRVYVLSAAMGTVVQVGDGCGHDYPKSAGQDGALVDPCTGDGQCLGKYVLVDHGGGVTALYAHLSQVYVSVGDSLRQGSLLGRSGATGSVDQVGFFFQMMENGQTVDPRTRIKLPAQGEPIQD